MSTERAARIRLLETEIWPLVQDQNAADRGRSTTSSACPTWAPADTEVAVKRSGKNTRIADVAVFQARPLDRAVFVPDLLELVIEVVSETSFEDDLTDKPQWYAAAGIPGYWRVEPGDDPDPGAAAVYQHKLARTATGHAAYVESGVTTLAARESLRSES